MKNMYITDQEDMIFWFSIIENNGAKTVLDIGLFLERIGAIARQVGGMALPSQTRLDGYNLSSQQPLPIYETVYDQIIIKQEDLNTHYDLGLLLGIPEEWNMDVIKLIIRSRTLSLLAVDIPVFEMLKKAGVDLSNSCEVRTDNREYRLISF